MLNAERTVHQSATQSALRSLLWVAAAGLVGAAVACAPATDPQQPQPAQTKPEPPKAQDFKFDDFEDVKLTGVRFVPEGFGFPGMVRVVPRKKVDLEKQRKVFAKAKPDRQPTEAKILVTLLWDESKKSAQTDKDAAKALREEARTALQAVQTAQAEKTDAIILQMLFTAHLWLGDDAGAIAAGTELLNRYGDSKSAQQLMPWVAFLHLRNWQTADAAKYTQGWKLDDPKMDYLRAYVLAWVGFRQRNYEAARSAIVWAAKNWRSRATRLALERDLVLILARSGASVDDATALFAELAAGKIQTQYVWSYKLYEAYELAGYPKRAARALDAALALKGDQAAPMERMGMLQRQSTQYLYSDEPDRAASAAIAAYQGLATCGEACASQPDLSNGLAEHIVKLSSFFHTTFSVTLDTDYYGAAKKLYDFYLTLKREDVEKLRSYRTRLEETKQRSTAASGKHDKKTMELAIGFHNQAIKACYESILQGEPELKGAVKLTFSVADTGAVTGAETEPAGGAEGLAAVGTCLQDRARAWTFPSRTVKGTTVLSRSYQLEPAP
ncbi:MAG: AgmX/PglI C-terminal domain-containing protein [Proteobacteria bacterium]|nr:AgmX/PglI C-terminal domain-containing protein [Pseudomonadota bacterium]